MRSLLYTVVVVAFSISLMPLTEERKCQITTEVFWVFFLSRLVLDASLIYCFVLFLFFSMCLAKFVKVPVQDSTG